MRIYTGYIHETIDGDAKYMQGIDLNAPHRFIHSGEWVAGSRIIGAYQLCDDHGDTLPEFKDLQFSKDRRNRFYLESVG